MFGDGEQTLDYIHVSDVVDAIVLGLASDESGRVLNIGSGRGTRVRDLVATLARLAGSSEPPKHAPPDATAGTCRIADVTAARDVLGFSARVTLDEGLADVCAEEGAP